MNKISRHDGAAAKIATVYVNVGCLFSVFPLDLCSSPERSQLRADTRWVRTSKRLSNYSNKRTFPAGLSPDWRPVHSFCTEGEVSYKRRPNNACKETQAGDSLAPGGKCNFREALIGPYYHNQRVSLNYTSGETEQFWTFIYSFTLYT